MNKKEKAFQYKIAAIGAVLPFLISFGLDLIKDKPIFSTVVDIATWIWNNVLKFEFTVWQILLAIIWLWLVKIFINSYSKKDSEFLNYTTDRIKNNEWKWNWKKDSITGLWDIDTLIPVCPKCDIGMLKLVNQSGGFMGQANCPKCDLELREVVNPRKIALIIHDNIEKGLHLNKNEEIK